MRLEAAAKSLVLAFCDANDRAFCDANNVVFPSWLEAGAAANAGQDRPGPRGHHGGRSGRVHPTDSGLLARGVSRIADTIARVKAAGGATRTLATDRRRAASRRVRTLTRKPKLRGARQRGQAQIAVWRITGELAGLAD